MAQEGASQGNMHEWSCQVIRHNGMVWTVAGGEGHVLSLGSSTGC
jgi:hypothetical protein